MSLEKPWLKLRSLSDVHAQVMYYKDPGIPHGDECNSDSLLKNQLSQFHFISPNSKPLQSKMGCLEIQREEKWVEQITDTGALSFFSYWISIIIMSSSYHYMKFSTEEIMVTLACLEQFL